MIYGAENNIIQTTDHLYLWAFLTDNNGNRLANEEVSFYKVKDDVETQIGSAVSTDSKGIASLDYVGGGVGQIGIRAKYGSVVSQTYEILDTIFYDKGILNSSENNDNWVYFSKMTRGENGTTFTNSNWNASYPKVGNEFFFTVDSGLCMEFEITNRVASYSTATRIVVNDDNNTSDFPFTGTGKYKVIAQNGTAKCFKDDAPFGTDITYTGTSLAMGFRNTANEASITFKDFKLYRI